MAKGGKRPGAGRPKGAISKSTAAIIEAAKAGGETPLDYALRIMRDDNAPSDRRDEMCKVAMPFVHSRLSPVETPSGGPRDLSKLTNAELDSLERISRKIAGAYGDPSGKTTAQGRGRTPRAGARRRRDP